MKTGRNNSFIKTIKELHKTFPNQSINIIETGTIRGLSETSKFGDGWSSYHWGDYCVKTKSNLWCVDIDQHAINLTKEVHDTYFEPISVEYLTMDSIKFLSEFDKPIDFLFLDSYDYCGDEENVRRCHEHQLNEVKAALPNLRDNCLILIDDVFNNTNYDGKGKLSIPYLLSIGFETVHYIENQILLKRKRKIFDFVDESFYINLDKRTDRRETMENRFKTNNLFVNRFSAIEVKEENVKNYYNKKNEYGRFWEGTMLSHQNIIKYAKDNKLENVMIFEDDALFVEDFYNKAMLCIEELKNLKWDIFYFGGEPNGTCLQVTEHVSKIMHGMYCNHAYIINNSFYDNVLELTPEFVANIDLGLLNYDVRLRTYLMSKELLCYQDYSHSDAHSNIGIDSVKIFDAAYKKFVK